MEYKDFAMLYNGVKQGTLKHREIINGYNNGVYPLPRGYRVTYNDSWCATFVSYVLLKCGAVNAPYECSVYYMKQLALANKQVYKTPRINDIIVYDWKNNGTLDHVGIVYAIYKDTLTIIEGNKSKQVGIRTINKNSNEIDCYIRVSQLVTSDKLETVAKDVINGKYGNGTERKAKLESLGYNYKEVQNIVNSLLKK